MSIMRHAVLAGGLVTLLVLGAAPPSSAEPGKPEVAAAPAEGASSIAEAPGCPHAGKGPCCTSCREKREQALAAGVAPESAEEAPGGCPCRRARKLAGGS
jgi:hypothetical protein